MNRIYKVLWSTSRNTWIAAGELAKAQGKSRSAVSSASSPSAPRIGTLLLAAGLSVPAAPALAELPGSGTISAGSGSISSDGTDMVVTQSSERLSVNWLSFSIGKDNSVTFEQPSASSIALNRVTGSDVSTIQGALSANGRVFLINPNGVLFNPTAQVNVGGLVASTLELSDEDFLAGRHTFEGDSTAAVINEGAIRAAQGGAVALVAARIVNEGSIEAPGGTVAMGSGSRVTLDLGGPVKLRVEKGALNGLIEQGGAIEAGGGQVYLTAKAAGELASSVINHTGVTEARTLASGENGEIVLLGDMDNGEVNAAGELAAGFVETSAAGVNIDQDLNVDTQGGEWLIDPVNIEIDTGKASAIQTALESGDVTVTTADGGDNSDWSGGTNGTDTEEGNITVNAAIDWASHTLTLRADNDITINAELTSTGTTDADGLFLQYAQTTGSGTYTINAPVNLKAGSLFKTQQGSDEAITWTVIDALGSEGSTTGTDLQGMNGDLGGNYVLGADIDASATASWNSDEGFDPVGTFDPANVGGNEFTGRFDGLGHTISDLTINRPSTDNIGLFGSTDGATLRNVGLVGGSVTGDDRVGGLVGHNNSSTISNAYATGSVEGSFGVGGLVGENTNSSTISNAYATGSVSGDFNVGGLVGTNNTDSTISNAYATGSVSGGGQVGGLAGENSNSMISNAYATGSVAARLGNVGGLVGHNVNSTVTNSYWNTETSGQGSSPGGTGLTTAEMQNPFTFIDAGWDFETVWGKSSNSDTPENSGYMMLRGVGVSSDALYDDYVRLSDTNTGKTYGDANPEFLDFPLDGVGKDNVSLDWGSAITNTTDVGTYAYSGAGVLDVTTTSANGVYVDYGAGGLTIDKAALTVTANDVDKTYDGQAFTGGNGVTYDGFVADEDENVLGGSLSFGGTAQNAVNAGGYTLTADGLLSDNYVIDYAEGTLTVSKADLTITANDVDKTYDGQTFTGGNGVTYAGFVAGEDESVLNGSLSFGGDAQNAVNAGSYSLTADGLAADNYDISYAGGTLTVDQATIANITGITAEDKTYDGTTAATLDASGAGFTGIVSGDTLTVATASGAFADKNAGSDKTVTISGLTLGGGDAGNYTLADDTATTSADIDQASIANITGITAEDKTYDGTTDATLDASGAGFTGMVAGDTLTVATASGAFADKNAGSDKTVAISGLTLGGDDAGNYTLDSDTATTTADIDKASIAAITGITAEDKTYDGTTDATLDASGAGFTGMVAGDTLTVATASGAFADKNAGSDKMVNITGLTLGGGDAGNYTLDSDIATTTADIDKASIAAITGIAAEDKTYDGTTDATLDASGAGFTGMVAGDTLTVATASGAFADKNAGSDKTVDITDLTLGGGDAGNYTLDSNTATTSADIDKASIAAITGIAAEDKTYDGTTDATLDASGAGFTGMV
ncbi:YDG domain-containing protein, partial [Microbulbifer sp.]|uniref:YDG domain-containing protein n=1 Tax=Microbulbifer sp. TaxID=1908541 RepID=UPI003F410CEB